MMFPVKEVCGGKGLVDKSPSLSYMGLWASLRGICRAAGV
jgi:hypothetical protein